MTQFDFFPSDERLAQALGLTEQWEALQAYSWALGYPLWCTIAGLFFVLEMLVPACRTSWIMYAAVLTGIVVKLGEVYGWGHFSFGEQITMFVLLTSATFLVWISRIGARPAERSRRNDEADLAKEA